MHPQPPNAMPRFRPLTGVYEPSAVQQLADGRFLVVEDEWQHPFSLFRIESDGQVVSTPLNLDPEQPGHAIGKLSDLEGITLDADGYIHAITSHSRTGDGKEKKSRDKLIRFRIEAGHILEPVLATGLKPALLTAHPVLGEAAVITDVKDSGGLNIEALEFDFDQQRLLIGFRGPLLDNRAIIAQVDNPRAMFEAGAPPGVAAQLITLDLGGDGIRGLSRLPALGGYLVIAGPVDRAPRQFRLWLWDGEVNGGVRPVRVSALGGFERAEGICPAVLDGAQRILVVSDDGDRKAGRSARYLLLDPAELEIGS